MAAAAFGDRGAIAVSMAKKKLRSVGFRLAKPFGNSLKNWLSRKTD